MGDRCLQQVAQSLSGTVMRPPDMVARYGGEEFAVILPATDSPGAQVVGEALRKDVEDLKIEHASSSIANHLTISVGVAAIIPHQDMPSENLVSAADQALYRAKRDGRNRVAAAD